MALQKLLDKNELQRLQDGFCKIAGVSAYCMNHEGAKITRLSGDDRYLHCLQERLALDRVMGEDSLEDLAIEEIEGQKLVAAIAIKARGEKELYWIVFKSEDMDAKTFDQILELLHDASITFLQGKLMAYGAEAESVRNERDSRRMGQSIRMNQATARIVQLLESTDPTLTIMSEWLQTVSSYLELDTAQIFKLQENDKFMDVICEWRKPGQSSCFDRTSHLPAYAFLRKQTPVTVNADTAMDPEFQDIYNLGVKAMMLYPVGPRESGFVVSLNHRSVHVFDAEEEKFTADAVKILENVLTGRIQKNSLNSAYVSMETVLDGLNTCVMVRADAGRRILYVNRLFQETFSEELKGDKFAWLLTKAAEETEEPKEEDTAYRERREVYYKEKERWYDLATSDVRWVDGSVVRMYSLIDVTDRKTGGDKAEKPKEKVEEKPEEKPEEKSQEKAGEKPQEKPKGKPGGKKNDKIISMKRK